MTGYNNLTFNDNTSLSMWTHFTDAQQGSNKYHNRLNSIAQSDFTTHIWVSLVTKGSTMLYRLNTILFLQGQSLLMFAIKGETT